MPDLEEVVVKGRHGGDQGVLRRDRVSEIAGDLAQRIDLMSRE